MDQNVSVSMKFELCKKFRGNFACGPRCINFKAIAHASCVIWKKNFKILDDKAVLCCENPESTRWLEEEGHEWFMNAIGADRGMEIYYPPPLVSQNTQQ